MERQKKVDRREGKKTEGKGSRQELENSSSERIEDSRMIERKQVKNRTEGWSIEEVG